MRQTARKMRALPAVFPLYPLQRFFAGFECTFELACFHRFQDFAKPWARFHSQRNQVISRNQGRRNDRLVRELFLLR